MPCPSWWRSVTFSKVVYRRDSSKTQWQFARRGLVHLLPLSHFNALAIHPFDIWQTDRLFLHQSLSIPANFEREPQDASGNQKKTHVVNCLLRYFVVTGMLSREQVLGFRDVRRRR